MRQFLYMDIDIVNSIIAQANKGLIDNITLEDGKEDSKEKTKSTAGNIDGSAEAGFWKLAKAEATLGINASYEGSSTNTINSKQIIAKTLHDASFEIAYDAIEPIEILVGKDDAELGQYVEMTRVFNFVDFEYLDQLFSQNGFVDFIKKTEKEKIEKQSKEITGGLNREQARQAGTKIKDEINKLIKESGKQYDDIHDVISALKHIVPYNRMLVSSDGYLIPMDDNYFRINPSNMGFKYGGEIKCVGLITNIIGEDTNPEDSANVFASLQFATNEVLRMMLPTKENNLYVVHPIAIFYEN